MDMAITVRDVIQRLAEFEMDTPVVITGNHILEYDGDYPVELDFDIQNGIGEVELFIRKKHTIYVDQRHLIESQEYIKELQNELKEWRKLKVVTDKTGASD